MSEENWQACAEIFGGSARKIQESLWAQPTLEEERLLNSRFGVRGPKRAASRRSLPPIGRISKR